MPFFVKLLAPAIAGGVLGLGAIIGLVSSQTSVPDPADNPASQPILTYGD